MNSHTTTDVDESNRGESLAPQPLTSLTGFKRDQLFTIELLADRNPHGMVIKDELDRYYEDEISPGRLYQNLGELVEEGHVEKHPLDGRTNAYQLSAYAAERLREHHEWERHCLRHENI